MNFFEKMKLARENKDHKAFGELLAESYTFVRHQTGTRNHYRALRRTADCAGVWLTNGSVKSLARARRL